MFNFNSLSMTSLNYVWFLGIHSALALHGSSGFPLAQGVFAQLGRSITVFYGTFLLCGNEAEAL